MTLEDSRFHLPIIYRSELAGLEVLGLWMAICSKAWYIK